MAAENTMVFTWNMGDMEISMLSENSGRGNSSLLIGADEAMLKKYLSDGTYPTATNAFLVRGNGRNVLVDTGFGRNLPDNLKSLGLSYDDIDAILITHMHGDHVNGLLKDGAPAFARQQVYIPAPELAYWTDEAVMKQQPENRQGGFKTAMEIARLYGNRITTFQPGELGADIPDLLPGIRPVAAYGHTPGHSMFLASSNGRSMMFWGDLTHAMAIQMPEPGVALTYDSDPAMAVRSRLAVLEYLAANDIPAAGDHVPAPAMGSLKSSPEGGYSFTPLK